MKTIKWKRVRPGLYQGRYINGHICGVIERGGETRRWWWEVAGTAGFSDSLREAKDEAKA